jgi:hypothetical protein
MSTLLDGAAAGPPHHSDGGVSEIPKWLQIIAPTTIIPALVLYFGWVRTNAIALYFGVDPGVLGLSAQDYALRSADVLFLPAGVLLTAALLSVWAHSLILHHLHAHHHRYSYVIPVLVLAGTGSFLLGALAAWQGLPFSTPFLIPQLSPGVGIGLLAYALHLRRHQLLLQDHRRTRVQHAIRGVRLLTTTFMAMLIVLSLFWAASEYAMAVGTGRGETLAAQLSRVPGAVLYAKERLHIDAPGTVETDLGDSASTYRYRYRGLRLVFGTAESYVLIPAVWSRQTGVAIVLPRTASVRIEFVTVGLP